MLLETGSFSLQNTVCDITKYEVYEVQPEIPGFEDRSSDIAIPTSRERKPFEEE